MVDNDPSNVDDGEPGGSGRYPERVRNAPRPYWLPKRPRVNTATSLLASTEEPSTYEEAVQAPAAALWRQAMDEEMASLIANETWELEEVPPGVKPLPVKWVYKLKRDAQGNIERYMLNIERYMQD